MNYLYLCIIYFLFNFFPFRSSYNTTPNM